MNTVFISSGFSMKTVGPGLRPDLLKISRLPLDVVRVRSGDELELDVLPVWLAQRHDFEKFH